MLTPGRLFSEPEAGFELEVVDVTPAAIRVDVRVEPGAHLASVDRPPVLDFLSPPLGETLRGGAVYEVTAYDPDVERCNGAGIDSVRLELHRLSDALIERVIRGDPPPPGAIATAESMAPPFRLAIPGPGPGTGVYALVATAIGKDGGSNAVWLPHLIEGP